MWTGRAGEVLPALTSVGAVRTHFQVFLPASRGAALTLIAAFDSRGWVTYLESVPVPAIRSWWYSYKPYGV